jgi:hypothetical protein
MGDLVSPTHHKILIKIPLANKAGWENDLSIVPIKAVDDCLGDSSVHLGRIS